MAIIKGQNLRVMIDYNTGMLTLRKLIACATSCTIHIAASTEDTSHKDCTGMWAENSVTGMSWDGSADALVAVPEDNRFGAVDLTRLVGEKVKVSFCQMVDGIEEIILIGDAIINDISITAGNKQNATYSVQFTGTGALDRQQEDLQ